MENQFSGSYEKDTNGRKDREKNEYKNTNTHSTDDTRPSMNNDIYNMEQTMNYYNTGEKNRGGLPYDLYQNDLLNITDFVETANRTEHEVSFEKFKEKEKTNKNDPEWLKTQWRKEKNRMAAKKSREKKAIHIQQLEEREKRLSINCIEYNTAIHHYDQLLHLFVNYSKEIIKRSTDDTQSFKHINGQFLEFIERIKNRNNGVFLSNIQHLTTTRIMVSDSQLNELINSIINKLNEKNE